MTTTLSIDSETRDLASKQAKKDRLTVSGAARMLLRAYAQGRIRLGAYVADDAFSADDAAAYRKAVLELKTGAAVDGDKLLASLRKRHA